jgi:uncharacterized membrane protein
MHNLILPGEKTKSMLRVLSYNDSLVEMPHNDNTASDIIDIAEKYHKFRHDMTITNLKLN